MDLKALTDQFRSDTDDMAEPYGWSKPDVTRWFNEAEEEAAIRRRLIFDKTSGMTELSLTAGDTAIELDPAIFEIRKAWLIDSAGAVHPLTPTDRIESDRLFPDWRTTTERPTGFIHDDHGFELNRVCDAAYTMRMEVYRTPEKPMVNATDKPEIAQHHHRMLVEWVKHRAYSKPDADLFNANEAEKALGRFEDYFGPRPDANLRRNQLANKPHHNKPHW